MAQPSRALLQNFAMPIALVAIMAFFGAVESTYLGSRNLTQLLIEFSTVAVLALGMFMIILTGNIDLSVGSGVGLIGGIAAVLIFRHDLPAPLALLAGLVAALVLWPLMGALIIRQRVPAFIITLGGLLIFKGLFWRVINNSTVPVSRGGEENVYSLITTYYLPAGVGFALAAVIAGALAWIEWRARAERRSHGLPETSMVRATIRIGAIALGIVGVVIVCNQFRGVPLTLVILSAVAAGVYFLTQHTPFGRYLYAIGGNEEAAVLSGINVHRVVIGAFALMGVTVAITGFMQTAYSGASTTTVGDLMELDAIAACVIGGTSLKGGRGTVLGVLFGAMIMTALLNGMQLLAVEPHYRYVARGVVLVLAVWMDVRFRRV